MEWARIVKVWDELWDIVCTLGDKGLMMLKWGGRA